MKLPDITGSKLATGSFHRIQGITPGVQAPEPHPDKRRGEVVSLRISPPAKVLWASFLFFHQNGFSAQWISVSAIVPVGTTAWSRVVDYVRADLEQSKVKGERMNFSVVGMLKLAADIPPELAADVIESVRVRGVFQASEAVKAALVGRIK